MRDTKYGWRLNSYRQLYQLQGEKCRVLFEKLALFMKRKVSPLFSLISFDLKIRERRHAENSVTFHRKTRLHISEDNSYQTK